MEIRPTGNVALPPPRVAERDIPAAESTVVAKSVAAPAQANAAVQQPAPAPTVEQVTQAIKSLNKVMADLSQGLEFTIDSDSHRTIVKVVDMHTKEVIRQIPSEEMLQIAKALDQISGLLIKQKA